MAETLLARMFYWGNVSYRDNYLDSTKARGWWGMELAWMEDLVFSGKIGAASFDFNLTSVVQYHFQLLAAPGADGFLNRVNDTAYWTWGPILSDYTDNWSPKHTISELERSVRAGGARGVAGPRRDPGHGRRRVRLGAVGCDPPREGRAWSHGRVGAIARAKPLRVLGRICRTTSRGTRPRNHDIRPRGARPVGTDVAAYPRVSRTPVELPSLSAQLDGEDSDGQHGRTRGR